MAGLPKSEGAGVCVWPNIDWVGVDPKIEV